MRVALFVVLLACNDASSGSDAGSHCPASPPNDGDPCVGSTTGQHCEYRSSPTCVVGASCVEAPPSTTFRWSVISWPGCFANPSTCPTTFADVPTGASCSIPSSDVCAYDEGNCACEPCVGDAGTAWRCNTWSSVAGCSSPRPIAGTACATEGATCDYGECCNPPALGPPLKCTNGVWIEYTNTACKCVPATCP